MISPQLNLSLMECVPNDYPLTSVPEPDGKAEWLPDLMSAG